jgi:hypothetical protein
LRLVKQRKIIDAGERIGMIEAQRALAAFQRALVKLLSLGLTALRFVKRGQIADTDKRFGLIQPPHALEALKRALI